MPNFSGVWNLKEQIQAIAAGRWTGIATGELYTWGLNTSGQLGNDSTQNQSSPVQISGLNWSKVSAGAYRTFAIKSDGTLYGWGENASGAVGDNTIINCSSPVQVGALTNWAQVSAGGVHSLAVKTDNTLWAWGYDLYGGLGISIRFAKRSSPVQVGALTDWAFVSAAISGNSLAVKTDGTLWAWGDNFRGQLGLNSTTACSSPIQVGALTNWSVVSAGNVFSLSVKTNGTLWAWGRNVSGQLGLNDAIDRSSPVQVGAATDWSTVSAGSSTSGFSASIKTNGTLWTWGADSFGQLGQGVDFVFRSSPTQVGALTNWANVSVGNDHAVSSKTDGTLWTWGRNQSGQNGTGNTIARSSPVQVGSLTSWSEVSAGSVHTVAISQGTTN